MNSKLKSKNSKLLFVTAGLLSALATNTQAQQPKIPRIGYLVSGFRTDSNPSWDAFRQGLRDLGYIEGKNIVLEYRYAERKLDRSPSLAAELVQLKVDVIFVSFLPGIRAAKDATKTIPIVMVSFVDPVVAGLVDSLGRPGGNITGLSMQRIDLGGKRLELFKEIIPSGSRVAILWDANAPGPVLSFKDYEAAARALKIQLQSIEVRGPDPDIDGAFQAVAKSRVNALILVANPVLTPHRERIASMANKRRLPSMCESIEYVEAGCLMSYSANQADLFRRAAHYVDKILKGAKPGDLPVEQPTKFELVINLKAAKQIGLTIPQSVLYRADRVIK
ncbi:MAG TPA: ABC transporter substrate-binding protein [Verrucomicrobiae bacterium]|nr:ABC transporter substrate-binding protein [Verrucomicrobiae bacterium]